MTYRARSRGRRERRQAMKEERLRAEVHARTRAWLEAHPPRVELPVDFGHWERDQTSADGTRYIVDFQHTERPAYPVVRVPIMPNGIERRLAREQHAPSERMLTMRAVRMRLGAGATVLRWWNWEPEGQFDGEADLYRAVTKALSMMVRVREPLRKLLDFGGRAIAYEIGAPADGIRWFDELRDALEEWSRGVRVRYVVPGRRSVDAPEERDRMQR